MNTFELCATSVTPISRVRRIFNKVRHGHVTHECAVTNEVDWIGDSTSVYHPHRGAHVCWCGYRFRTIELTSKQELYS